MAFSTDYESPGPSREAIDGLAGAVLLEFGTPWCGFCRAAQPRIAAALDSHPGVRHVKVEDGPGRRLGRSFRVKLWPTLVLLRDGQVLETLVRPREADDIAQALDRLDPR